MPTKPGLQGVPPKRFGSFASHSLQALLALSSRETVKFLHQRGRLLSALV